MILDKLIEKKDLMLFLNLREEYLKNQDVTKVPPKFRNNVTERLKGRVAELKYLKKVLNNLKKVDKRYWKENVKANLLKL